MPRRPRKRPQSAPGQMTLLDLIEAGKLNDDHKEALRGLIATRPQAHAWRGQDIVPPNTLLDCTVDLFRRTTDFPLELPAFGVLHVLAAHLLDNGVEIEVAGTRFKPDLWSTLLAPSGAGKTKTVSVLRKVMPVRLFPETTTAARFMEELANHNNGLWLQDEWAQLLKRMESQTYAEEMREYLLRLYDNAPMSRRTAKASLEIDDPALVILGTTVLETFCQNVSPESMLDGFMQRFGIIIGDADPERTPDKFPLYRVEEQDNLVPLHRAWGKIAALPMHAVYTVTAEGEDVFCQAFRHGIVQHHSVPPSFFRRAMWRCFKYACVYHVLLGKAGSSLDAEDVGWAVRVAFLHLTDARRLLDGYQLTELESLVVKAEALQAKLGRRPSNRELIGGVRGIKNAHMAKFVMELMTPLPSNDNHTAHADTPEA